MAIGDSDAVDLVEVFAEFGSNTKPATEGLSEAHSAIFGTFNTGELDDFTGYGQPYIDPSGVSTLQITTDGFRTRFFIDTNNPNNNVNSTVKVFTVENTGFIPTDVSDFTNEAASQTFVTSDTNDIVITGLNSGTDYYYILRYYNNFNSNSNDWLTTFPTYYSVTTAAATTTTTTLPLPTATISPSSTTVNEGDAIFYTVTTSGNIPSDADLDFEVVSGGSDFTPSSGTFSTFANSGTFTVGVDEDFTTEGTQSFTLNVSYEGNVIGTASITVNDTSTDTTTTTTTTLPPEYDSFTANRTNVNEGEDVTFTVSTISIPNGRTIGYTASGVSSADISGEPLTGSITINNNVGSKTFSISADATTEGTERMTVTLDESDSGGETSGLPLSDFVDILDTSVPPRIRVYAKTLNAGEVDPNVKIQYEVSGDATIRTVYDGALDSNCIQRGSDITTNITSGQTVEFFTDQVEDIEGSTSNCPPFISTPNTGGYSITVTNTLMEVYLTIDAQNAVPTTTTTTTTTTIAPLDFVGTIGVSDTPSNRTFVCYTSRNADYRIQNPQNANTITVGDTLVTPLPEGGYQTYQPASPQIIGQDVLSGKYINVNTSGTITAINDCPVTTTTTTTTTKSPASITLYARTDEGTDPSVQIQYKVNGGNTQTYNTFNLDDVCSQRGAGITGLLEGDIVEFFTDENEKLNGSDSTTCPSISEPFGPTSFTTSPLSAGNNNVALTIQANNAATPTTTTTTTSPFQQVLVSLGNTRYDACNNSAEDILLFVNQGDFDIGEKLYEDQSGTEWTNPSNYLYATADGDSLVYELGLGGGTNRNTLISPITCPSPTTTTTTTTASLTSYSSSVVSFSATNACNLTLTETYHHDGTGSEPQNGDSVYSDSSGTSFLSNGFYQIAFNQYIEVSSGVVIDKGLCNDLDGGGSGPGGFE